MRSRDRTESGFTVVELTVASALLMLALAGFFAGLASVQRTTAYESGRSRALDDLRTTAGTFAKDLRHASEITYAAEDEVVMQTYVRGAVEEVTYQVVATGGDRDLLRTASGGSRLFVIKLTSASIFEFGDVALDDCSTTPCHADEPDLIRRVQLHMESRPQVQYPPVVLATEVSLRNVT